MIDSLRETVSQRVSSTPLLLLLSLTAATSGWFDSTFSAVTLPAVGELTRTILVNTVWTLFLAGNDAVVWTLDLPERASNAGLGAAALAVATGLRASFGASRLFTVALLLVGVWFLLDGMQSIRHDDRATAGERSRLGDDPAAGDGRRTGSVPITDQPSRDSAAVYEAYVARRVHETVSEERQTRHDLVDEPATAAATRPTESLDGDVDRDTVVDERGRDTATSARVDGTDSERGDKLPER